jgi:UDP-N-acetylglucosamine 2-epimerase (non-hydrolysing)
MSRIAVFIGTRPELIKCKPLLDSSSIYLPVFVEQHSTLLSDVYVHATHKISITESSDNRLNNIISSILNANIWDTPFLAVMVQGDTAVAYAAALAAFHRGIKIIHLEAGLRTYNIQHPWPEEAYRRMIDVIADVGLCPSELSVQHLIDEKFKGIAVNVGNTSIDAICQYALYPKIGNKVIITLHRRENWARLAEFFEVIERLATLHTDLEFIIPLHPNPLIQKLQHILKNVRVIDPVPHYDMCKLIEECNCIISDSGGIQEEAGWLGKRVFCCRETTEREELLQYNVCLTPTPDELFTRFTPQTDILPAALCYGHGDACGKINTIIAHLIEKWDHPK